MVCPSALPTDEARSIRYDRTCPIANISFEILSHIFALSEESFRADFAPFISTPATCALSFSRVCKFWHTVALQTPMLWTSVSIASESDSRAAHKWYERSRNLSMTVDMRVSPTGRGLASSSAYEFLKSHYNRLGTLFFDLDRCLPSEIRYPWPSGPNKLVSLELINVWLSFPTLCHILKMSPMLKNLHVGQNRRDHRGQTVISFFEQVGEEAQLEATELIQLRLDTRALRSRELCGVLRLCPKLQYLALCFKDLSPTPPLPAVHLPSLLAASLPEAMFTQVLVRHWTVPSACVTLFGQDLSCSQLRECITETDVPWGTTYDADFAKTVLSVYGLKFYLERSPQIRKLTLSNWDESISVMIDFLCLPTNGSFPLPNLKHLVIRGCTGSGDLRAFSTRYYGSPGSALRPPPPLHDIHVFRCPEFVGVEEAIALFTEFGTSCVLTLPL